MANREIKFRAWDATKKMWLDYDYVLNMSVWTLTAKDSIWLISQFTGLKDKNGVEIYEGDILSYGGKWRAPVDFGELKFSGDYDGDDYYGLGFRVGSEPLDPRGEPLEYIVIGNIYENPELLKD